MPSILVAERAERASCCRAVVLSERAFARSSLRDVVHLCFRAVVLSERAFARVPGFEFVI